MATFTLEVPDSEVSFFTKLIDSLRFVRRVDETQVEKPANPARQTDEPEEEYRPKTKEEIIADIREAWDELIELRAGRMEAPLLSDVIKELRSEGL